MYGLGTPEDLKFFVKTINKMKIAICISGLIGHTAKGGKGIPIDFTKQKNILIKTC